MVNYKSYIAERQCKEEKMVRVGISGFGRISRVVMRAAMDMEDVEIA